MEELRLCKKCGQNRPLDEFYSWKRGNGVQRDPRCKECKKRSKAGCPSSAIGESHIEHPPPEIIEPVISGQRFNSGDNGIDWSFLESRYKRALTESERTEIKANVCDFFRILFEENGNLCGQIKTGS